MSLTDVLLTSGLTTIALTAVLVFLLKGWISTRLQESIGAEYKEALELFKQQIAWEERRKQQAAEVADVLSLFVLNSYDNKTEPNLTRYELQKQYWKLALSLDAAILQKVHDVFKSWNSPIVHQLNALIAVRRMYVGEHDAIQPEELWHWNPLPPAGQEK